MKSFEKSADKIRLISDELRHNTLAPAKQEAAKLIEDAKREAKEIREKARNESDAMLANARTKIKNEESVLKGTLEQAYKLALENFKKEVKEKVIAKAWGELVKTATSDDKVVASMITSLVKAIEKEGIESDIRVHIPPNLKADKINSLLAKGILDRLADKGVLLSGNIDSGIVMRLEKKDILFDFTGDALQKVLLPFIYEGFKGRFLEESK